MNKRFTPAFDAIRIATARAVQQCLFRYQERILVGDVDAERRIMRMLGPDDGPLVIKLLRNEDFDDGVLVELTAASATANRESDRQNAIMLINMLGQYYKGVIELMTLVTTPGIPPQMQAIGMKIVDASAEAMERTIRTFDQIRDPDSFIIRLQDVAQSGGMQPNADMGQLVGMLSQAAAQNQMQPQGANGAGPPNGGGQLQ